MRLELTAPDFFRIPLGKVAIENVAETGRTYFIYRDKIVAVGVDGYDKRAYEGMGERKNLP